jgi:hypothetical protein
VQATRRNPRDGRTRSEGVLPAMLSSGTPDISYFRQYDRVEQGPFGRVRAGPVSCGEQTVAGGRWADTGQPQRSPAQSRGWQRRTGSAQSGAGQGRAGQGGASQRRAGAGQGRRPATPTTAAPSGNCFRQLAYRRPNRPNKRSPYSRGPPSAPPRERTIRFPGAPNRFVPGRNSRSGLH